MYCVRALGLNTKRLQRGPTRLAQRDMGLAQRDTANADQLAFMPMEESAGKTYRKVLKWFGTYWETNGQVSERINKYRKIMQGIDKY